MSNILELIWSNWQSDASNESNEKYFFHYDEVDTVLNGKNCFVVGRKGSGKTAICHYIESKDAYNHFTKKLDFKNFPFNLLYNFQDNNYPAPHKYITLWVQLIYMEVLKLFMNNEQIDSTFKETIKKAFPFYMEKKLENQVKQLDSWNANISLNCGNPVSKIGGSVGAGASYSNLKSSWVDNEDTLFSLIKDNCDDSFYYVVFDALDEDYSNVNSNEFNNNYLPLLTSLFKAVQKVRTSLKGFNIYPVVFLRDDIYNLIK